MGSDLNNLQPPIPREQMGPTESELIPFKSTKINIWKSKALVPLVLIALAVVALFTTMDSPLTFITIFGWVGVIAIFLGIYFYAGIQKQWWWYFVPALIAWVLLQYAFGLYALFFRNVLPGNVSAVADNPNFIPNFIAYFFGAGMCEEGLKATPVLIALALTLRHGIAPSGASPGFRDILNRKPGGPEIFSALALRGPLDGMLMGFAAGAAFIVDETLGEYVPNQIERVLANSHDQGLALFAGIELLIPRILQGVSGHMAWAAIFGYFIGLAAKYPRRWIQLVAIGYATAAVLHG
ncbi:MAG TPA: PrsW family glutamic-type intramembrane protease, partial [Beijerinckiaceae bacterium]|nr:PrsW family glutamic-type intramembrane protease [Beijerinckiaceae bacterium]